MAGAFHHAIRDVHGQQDKLRLVGEAAAGEPGQQRVAEAGFKVSPAPVDSAAGPIRHSKNVLGRHSARFAIFIAELNGIGAPRVDDHDDV